MIVKFKQVLGFHQDGLLGCSDKSYIPVDANKDVHDDTNDAAKHYYFGHPFVVCIVEVSIDARDVWLVHVCIEDKRECSNKRLWGEVVQLSSLPLSVLVWDDALIRVENNNYNHNKVYGACDSKKGWPDESLHLSW